MHSRRVAVFFEHEKGHASLGPESFPNCYLCVDDIMSVRGIPKDDLYQEKMSFQSSIAQGLVKFEAGTGKPEVEQPEVADFLLHGFRV